MHARSRLIPITLGLFVAVVCLAVAPAVQAETLDIVITGLSFEYDGSQIYDVTDVAGGNLTDTEAVSVASAMFSTDTNNVSDATAVYADLLIENVGGIPGAGGFDSSLNANSFGIDLFSMDGTAWWLQLNLSKLQVVYVGPSIAVAATGKASSVADQYLPVGVPAIDENQDIQVTIVSGTITDVETDNNGFLTAFKASNGVVSISAAVVPEPAQCVGMLSTALVLAGYFWTRRRR